MRDDIGRKKIYCMNCGKEIEPFYSFCIFCGATTADNPGCIAEKEIVNSSKQANPRIDHEIKKNLEKVKAVLKEDEEMYKGLLTLEVKMKKVMDKSEELMGGANWESVNTLIQKLYAVYLPKTIAVLEHYAELFSNDISRKDGSDLRGELLSAIDESSEVYDNILASLYERDVLELKSEIEALKTMLAREGLLNSDFDI